MTCYLVCLSFVQGRSSNVDPAGIADVVRVDHDLERRVLDVLAVALHRHLVLADLAGCEGDAVVALRQLLEETRLLNSGRGHDEGLQGSKVVVAQVLGQGQLGAGADRDGVAFGAFARDLAGEGRSVDVLVGKLCGDLVLARSCWQVGDVNRSILVVLAVDLSFAGAFDCKRQPTCTSSLGGYDEL